MLIDQALSFDCLLCINFLDAPFVLAFWPICMVFHFWSLDVGWQGDWQSVGIGLVLTKHLSTYIYLCLLIFCPISVARGWLFCWSWNRYVQAILTCICACKWMYLIFIIQSLFFSEYILLFEFCLAVNIHYTMEMVSKQCILRVLKVLKISFLSNLSVRCSL